MILELHRLIENPKDLQLGVLKIDGIPTFTTAEPPWRDNKHNVSCIPTGEFKLHKFHSAKFDTELWKIDYVQNRSDVEIHWGNFPSDTDGCILLGMGYGKLRDFNTITASRLAIQNFMNMTERETELTLYIWED